MTEEEEPQQIPGGTGDKPNTGDAAVEALRLAKGKQPKEEDSDKAEDDSDPEENFEADEGEYDDSEDSDSDDEDDSEAGLPEAEIEDLEEAGPSQGAAKRKRAAGEFAVEIVEGASGDEVDPGMIIQGGRGARRGRGGPSVDRPRYSAQAQLDSDEDPWE